MEQDKLLQYLKERQAMQTQQRQQTSDELRGQISESEGQQAQMLQALKDRAAAESGANFGKDLTNIGMEFANQAAGSKSSMLDLDDSAKKELAGSLRARSQGLGYETTKLKDRLARLAAGSGSSGIGDIMRLQGNKEKAAVKSQAREDKIKSKITPKDSELRQYSFMRNSVDTLKSSVDQLDGLTARNQAGDEGLKVLGRNIPVTGLARSAANTAQDITASLGFTDPKDPALGALETSAQAVKNISRNELFGGALTPTEKVEFDKYMNAIDSKDPATVRANLVNITNLIARAQNKITEEREKARKLEGGEFYEPFYEKIEGYQTPAKEEEDGDDLKGLTAEQLRALKQDLIEGKKGK